MKPIVTILDPIRRKLGQNEYFEILSELEQNAAEAVRKQGSYEEMIQARDTELDRLREANKYAVREKTAAESFLQDMTNQRNKLQLDIAKLKTDHALLQEKLDDIEHEKAMQTRLTDMTKSDD